MVHVDRRAFMALGTAGALAWSARMPTLAADNPRTVAFADGAHVPALGQGSWHMADGRNTPEAAIEAMRLGISLGMTLVDTAEIYGKGRSEELIAKVIADQRDKIFLVSKVMPDHATEDGIESALRASLKRLGTDHLDLYLMHWRNRPGRIRSLLPFDKTADLQAAVKGFERVRAQGLTKRWGVSNFTVQDMETLFAIDGGAHCATNQVIYNLAARDIETGLMPWCAKQRMPIMAYSPLGAGGKAALLANPELKKVANARGVPPAVVALAWAMRDGQTIALMESGSAMHVREDATALTLKLSAEEIKALDDAFPPPRAG